MVQTQPTLSTNDVLMSMNSEYPKICQFNKLSSHETILQQKFKSSLSKNLKCEHRVSYAVLTCITISGTVLILQIVSVTVVDGLISILRGEKNDSRGDQFRSLSSSHFSTTFIYRL